MEAIYPDTCSAASIARRLVVGIHRENEHVAIANCGGDLCSRHDNVGPDVASEAIVSCGLAYIEKVLLAASHIHQLFLVHNAVRSRVNLVRFLALPHQDLRVVMSLAVRTV